MSRELLTADHQHATQQALDTSTPARPGLAPKDARLQAGNQDIQRLLGVPGGGRWEVSEPGDESERLADEAAAKALSAAEPLKSCDGCAEENPCPRCRAKREAEARAILHRQAASPAGREHAPMTRAGAAGAGLALPSGVREPLERGFGQNLGNVRVHDDAAAHAASDALEARAFTHRSDIYFGRGEWNPMTSAGRQLLAHEVAHVVHGGEDGRNRIHRNGKPGAPVETPADRRASTSGPCSVVVPSLSNAGLLTQLNRARVYLHQTSRGEGEFYDYANLLRRLAAERRSRISGGHVWLAETGLLSPPETLYQLEAGEGLNLRVRQVPGSAAAGAPRSGGPTFMTASQFSRFLERNGVRQADPARYFEGMDPDQPREATIALAEQTRRRMVSEGPFLIPGERPFDSADPFGLNARGPDTGLRTGIDTGPVDVGEALGIYSFPRAAGLPRYRTESYVPTAAELLSDTHEMPGLVTSPGHERVFLPGGARRPQVVMLSPGASDAYDPYGWTSAPGAPEGVGALGFLGRPGLGLGSTTGILWEGSHVSDVAILNDRMFTRGFRAPLTEHGMDTLTSHRGRATARLNVGTPGSYANDAIFGYGGEVWGSPGHWGNGSVMIVRTDGTPVQAAELMELMARRVPWMEGTEYRFSPPPEGSRAEAAAHEEARRRGLPRFDRSCGGHNCINVPSGVHETALGGLPLEYTAPDGTVVRLRDRDSASARNMSEFMNQPDEFWEANGLRRVRVGPQMWRGVGVSSGLGAATSLGSDLWRAAHGEDVSILDATGHVAISAGSAGVSVIAEDVAYTGLTRSMLSRGVSGGAASTLGRLGASTGVAVVIAPITTGLEMAFDDQEYTRIDYAAKMTRSGVAGAGGALAAGAYFALLGSEVPVAGNIIGFGVGVGGYYLTDWLLGDETEELVRETMGEQGCTD